MTTLTLKLSKEKIKLLGKNACKSGKTVEEYIYDLIDSLKEDKKKFDVTKDPIYNIKGRDSLAPEDLASRHDKYLYNCDEK